VEDNRVPLPNSLLGGRLPRPNTIVLHTQAFRDISVREVLEALLKSTSQDTLKTVQQIPGPRFRVTFRTMESKKLFLGREFSLRGERIIAQEIELPTLDVKLLYVPDEVSNQTIAQAMAKYGKVLRVDREMYRDWPGLESGVRIIKMTELSEGIPRKLFIGPFPVETRYRGQIPKCGRCGEFGHRVATCINEVKCFRCGQSGHVQRQCFKCFLCGQFGHVRASCPDNPYRQPVVTRPTPVAEKESSEQRENPPSNAHEQHNTDVNSQELFTARTQSQLSESDINSDDPEDENDEEIESDHDSIMRDDDEVVPPADDDLSKRKSSDPLSPRSLAGAAREINRQRRKRSKKKKR
jgi:hypothetical protein